jgi:hypothetical protein
MPERCCWGDGSGDPAGRSRFADYFADSRTPELIEHEVATLVGHRVFGIALGYEDLVDHNELRHGPTMAMLAGKLSARRKDCAPLAGKSTLPAGAGRSGADALSPHRLGRGQDRGLVIDLFLEVHQHPPKQIILDLDATDDPLHASGGAVLSRLWSLSSGGRSRTPGGLLLLFAALHFQRPTSVGG